MFDRVIDLICKNIDDKQDMDEILQIYKKMIQEKKIEDKKNIIEKLEKYIHNNNGK